MLSLGGKKGGSDAAFIVYNKRMSNAKHMISLGLFQGWCFLTNTMMITILYVYYRIKETGTKKENHENI